MSNKKEEKTSLSIQALMFDKFIKQPNPVTENLNKIHSTLNVFYKMRNVKMFNWNEYFLQRILR